MHATYHAQQDLKEQAGRVWGCYAMKKSRNLLDVIDAFNTQDWQTNRKRVRVTVYRSKKFPDE